MNIQGDQLIPLLTEVQDFIAASLAQHEKDAATISALQKTAQSERVVLEKVASIEPGKLRSALGQLSQMHIITSTESEKIASRAMNDPHVLLEVMVKLAEAIVMPQEGSEFIDQEGTHSVEDPDGWHVVAQGKVPRVKS